MAKIRKTTPPDLRARRHHPTIRHAGSTTRGARSFLAEPAKRLLIGETWVAAAGGGFIGRADTRDVDRADGALPTALAGRETLDQGKPLFVGRWAEIPGAINQFRFFSSQAMAIESHTIPTSMDYRPRGTRVQAWTVREPVGVLAAIVPRNSPLVLPAMKLAPALAAGCTIVLKAAEDTSLTALRLAELMPQAGLPPGELNIVTGYGSEAGAALAAHPDVDKVAFTGSAQTGRAILDAARGNLKHVSLELGGKPPLIARRCSGRSSPFNPMTK